MNKENKTEEKAKELATKKLRLKERRIAPEIGEKKSRWSPGLLRKISEVEVRAAEQSMVARIDEETGEAVGWRYPGRTIGSKAVKLTEEEAIKIAKSEVEVPEDAVFESVEFLDRGAPGVTCFVRWKHVVDDTPVEGDFIVVKINPETKDVISATKNWSVIKSG
jgi:hypothetical protein